MSNPMTKRLIFLPFEQMKKVLVDSECQDRWNEDEQAKADKEIVEILESASTVAPKEFPCLTLSQCKELKTMFACCGWGIRSMDVSRIIDGNCNAPAFPITLNYREHRIITAFIVSMKVSVLNVKVPIAKDSDEVKDLACFCY